MKTQTNENQILELIGTHPAYLASESIVPKPVFGCIVAIVEIFDVVKSEHFCINENGSELGILNSKMQIGLTEEEWNFGNYTLGRWIYRTRNLRRLKTPILAKGLQCVGWTLPADIEAKVRAQL